MHSSSYIGNDNNEVHSVQSNNDALIACREVARELLSLVIKDFFNNETDTNNGSTKDPNNDDGSDLWSDDFSKRRPTKKKEGNSEISDDDDVLLKVMRKVNDISSLLLRYDDEGEDHKEEEDENIMNSNGDIIKVLQNFLRCTYASSCLGNSYMNNNNNTMSHYSLEDKEDFIKQAWMPLTCHFWSPLMEDLPSCFFNQDETISKILFHGTLSQLPFLEHLYNNGIKTSETTNTTTAQAVISNDWKQFMHHFQYIIHMTYEACSSHNRRKCRLYMGMHYYTASLNNNNGNTRSISSKRWTKLNGNNNPIMEENINTCASGLDISLRLLHRILTGYKNSTDNVTTNVNPNDEQVKKENWYYHVLVDILLPLHRPNSYLLWRDQIPTLQLYHEELCRCMGFILTKYPQWTFTPVLSTILQLDTWPTASTQNNNNQLNMKSNNNSNTPKLVLLLHEMDSYLKLIHTNGTAAKLLSKEGGNTLMVKGIFISRLSQACASDNSRLAERALEFFQNDYMFSFFLSSQSKEADHHFTIIMKALTRNFKCEEIPWNPTVQKRTGTVLQLLQTHNPVLFAQVCNLNCKNTSALHASQRNQKSSFNNNNTITQENMKLSHIMKQWKQPSPSSTTNNNKAKAPPLTLTGVAPWAVSPQHPHKNQRSHQSRNHNPSILNNKKYRPMVPAFNSSNQKNTNMPLPVHGKIQSQASPSRKSPPLLRNNQTQRSATQTDGSDQAEFLPSNQQQQHNTTSEGLNRVLNFIAKLTPKCGANGESNHQNHWAADQLAESPLLLPYLKFHDLVFGQILGKGAFSTVQYARHIVKNKTRSDWPEYAVKIISTETIQALAYETNQIREIAILSRMVHPNISRIISSFRFRKGAYLVLEYANAGDLFAILQRHCHKNNNISRSNRKEGIEEQDACIVLGQVVAALHSIHELGFVYGDLKPENIMLTITGHVKLTDFGACRPYTVEAKDFVRSSTKEGLLKQLRNGDWKSSGTSNPKNNNLNNCDDWNATNDDWDDIGVETENTTQEEGEEDIRIEGTTAYLPPEVILGDIPSCKADTWALGCVLYQCLKGKPPLLESEESMTREKIVTFVNITKSSFDDNDDKMVSVSKNSVISPEALSLIDVCMNRSMLKRPSMMAIASHEFFQNLDVFQLYRTPIHQLNLPLDADSTTNTTMSDSKWSRRQLSSIWAPQPKSYNLHEELQQLNESNNQSSRRMISNTNECIVSRVPVISNSPIPANEETNGYFLSSARSKSAFPKPNLSSITEK